MNVSNSFLKKLEKHFPTPKYLNYNPVAIDFSPRAIRIFKLKKSKIGLVPDFYKEVRLSKPFEISEMTAENQSKESTDSLREVLEILKKLKKEFNLKYVVSSLPELKTYIFRTKLPEEASSNIASAIRFSLEENVPLMVNDVNFDYFVLNDDQIDHGDLDVVVNVFPKKTIDIYTKLLKKAGLYPLSFQSESVAFSNSSVLDGDGEPYLLIRFMSDRIGASIVQDGVIQYTSNIAISGEKVIENYEGEAANELKEELNKILIYWFTTKDVEEKHQKIETALIAGELTNSPGLIEFMEKYLKLSVETADVWSNCFSIEEYIPKIHQNDSLRYCVAIGLAIKAINYA